MTGNTIKYKDHNNNLIVGRVIDKIKENLEDRYLVVNTDTTISVVEPRSIKNVL